MTKTKPAVSPGEGSLEILLEKATDPPWVFLDVSQSKYAIQRFRNLDFSFSYNANVIQTGDGIRLQYALNGSSTYTTIKSWMFGTGTAADIIFTNTGTYNSVSGRVAVNSATTNIRFRLIVTGAKNLRFYIDAIKIEGLQ